MTGRRQTWAGFVLLAACLVSSMLAASPLQSAGGGLLDLGLPGLGTAALLATAVLLAGSVIRLVAVPLIPTGRPLFRSATDAVLAASIRSCDPDASGAVRPRAPGRTLR